MATARDTIVCDYEYMNDAQTDDELKCSICTDPFQNPVTIECKHTFCQHCIEKWLKSDTRCPKCRRKAINDKDKHRTSPWSPVKADALINQLNRLLIRCTHCQQMNIQRGNLLDHQSKCTKILVPCPSAHNLCPWTGPRNEQANHVATCSFQQLEPILTLLQTRLDKSTEIQQLLVHELEKQFSLICFLYAFINKGNLMNTKCKLIMGLGCSLNDESDTSKKRFPCVLCRKQVSKGNVSFHTCPSNDDSDYICRKCYDKCCPLEDDESDDDDEEDSDDDSEEDDDDD
ncbi:unnamed protein product [Adineta steineri]|uniref:RING-type domain-containing protein n=1 Tax=Adineta steineri TaxID=433720 RepID=A0A813NWS9_9BILA|nr:unnamed protein product [Adineta steineri]CAF0754436.1 unnamed protein product [Adineta steineri]CAF0870554.1 unnamed protein product [Adineta steineri]